MPATTQQFSVKGQSFTSPYTDEQCYARMVELGKANKFGRSMEFARSLAKDFKRRGYWTRGQVGWAHKLVLEAENVRENEFLAGFELIFQHLQGCRDRRDEGGKGLLNPAVTIQTEKATVCFKLTGKKSKRPRHISVAESPRFGSGKFYGWINEFGEFERYSSANDDVVALMQQIATDPGTQISALGRESGLCCYCCQPLTQTPSKIAGCGKTCSKKWQVWYPDAAETRAFLVDSPEINVGSSDADRWG